jgi:hypothetical protein
MASPGNISSQRLTKRAFRDSKDIAEYAPRLRKLIPNFDKLSRKKQSNAATQKYLQEEVFPNDPEYSDKAIKAEAMGLATRDYDKVGKTSRGSAKYLKDVKKMSPRGYRLGGKVHRGRTAIGNKD